MKNDSLLTGNQMTQLVLSSLQNWLQREPSYAYDSITVWDDVVTARGLYIDLYRLKLKDEFIEGLKAHNDLREIKAILNV